MAHSLVCLQAVDSIENIRDALTSNDHHAFPVLNQKGRLVGLIPRNFIIVLLKKHSWYSSQALEGQQSVSEKSENDYNLNDSMRSESVHKKMSVNESMTENMIKKTKYATKTDLNLIKSKYKMEYENHL